MGGDTLIAGRYVPTRLLGQGAAGKVWLCHDTARPGVSIALKVVEPDHLPSLQAEYATHASLKSSSLPELFAFHSLPDGGACIALEFIDGPNLAESIRDASLTDAVTLASEALLAIEFLHSFGILHRDLKPANVLTRRSDTPGARVAIIDLGLAAKRSSDELELSGTVGYMAPELFDGAAPSVRSDLYAVGMILLEGLLGAHPIDADPSELQNYLSALKNDFVRPETIRGDAATLFEWATQLAAVDPDSRPADAREAREALERALPSRRTAGEGDRVAALLASGKPLCRDATLGRIRAALKHESTRLVVVRGEDGAGKSRLVEWVRLEAIRYGWKISEGPPTVGHSVTPQLALVDDAHLAPLPLIEAVDAVVRAERPPEYKTLIAATPSRVQSAQLRRLMLDAEVSDEVVVVDVPPFTLDELRSILELVDPGLVEIAEQFNAATGGHAGTVVEILGSGERDLSRSIANTGARLARSIEALPMDERQWLQILALVDSPLPIDAISAASGGDRSKDVRIQENLCRRRLVMTNDLEVSLASRVIGKAVLGTLSAESRKTLASQLLIAIGGDSSAEDRSVMMSRLAQYAGQHERAIQQATEAAERAVSSGSWVAATAAYRLAICSLPRRDSRYHGLRLAHAQASEESGDYRSAYRSYSAAIRTAPLDEHFASLYSLKARAAARSGLRHAVLPAARLAQQNAHDAQAEGLALVALATANFVNSSWSEVIDQSQRAEELLASCKHPRAAEAAYMFGTALARTKKMSDATLPLGRAIRLAKEVGDQATEANAQLLMAQICRANGEFENALDHLDVVRLLATRSSMGRYQVWCASGAAEIYFSQGRFDLAIKERERSLAMARRLGNRTVVAIEQVALSELMCRVGRPATAEAMTLSIIEAPERLYLTSNRYFARLGLLEARTCAGDEPGGVEVLDSLGDPPESSIVALSLLTLSLEFAARCDRSPGENSLHELHEAERHPEANSELLARSWIAWSACELHRGDWRSALEAAVRARDVLKGAHHDLAAQVYLAMSRAHAKRGAKNEAEIALSRGREELDAAAVLIEDEEYRNDFLARPVFRELREKRHTFADAEDRLSALYEMSASLNSAHHPEDQLGVILDQALRAVRAERGLILLRSPGSEDYRVRVSRNLEAETEREAAEFSRTAVLAAEKGEPVLSINASDDERLKGMQSVSRFGIRSILCVPLRVRDETVGAVYADSRNDGAIFNPEDLRFLSAFANHAALALENAREMRELEARRDRLLQAAEERTQFGRIVGRSPAMQAVYTMVERVADTHLPVLIHGESGTGKELIAREIVERSPRAGKPFLTENCAAIAETLLESELFGHVKGAFTGADADKAGLFEQADGGTLFLDEVGDMSSAMQARLLRVLQEGEIRRVGDESRRKVDVRVITASHRNLPQRVAEGEFREDLLHRLQVLVIDLPSLRDRPLDVALLVDHFLSRIAKERRQPKVKIRTEALERFERYSWPGNVRQLENTLQRLSLLAEDGVITMQTIEQDPTLHEALLGKRDTAVLSLKANEEQQLREALEQSGGNRVAAAKLLGVSRATIFRKIKQYDL